jgi:AraC-like DNA-binding protein
MDILSEILESSRLNAEVYLHSSFCGDWAVDSSGSQQATFHVVARGSCWLHMPDSDQPEPLRAGDLVVFPHDDRHMISNSELLPNADVPLNQPHEGELQGPSTSMICGFFKFGDKRWNPLLDAMPQYLVIRCEITSDTGHMDSLINFMIYEAEAGRLGADVVINRLSDILFTHVVRTYIDQYKPEEGFIAALADSKLSKCLDAFHKHPGDSWSVESLATKAGMSRSAFSEYFHHVTDQTPMQYVKQWRMQKAYDLLTTTKLSTQQIAEQCGYQSEASFSKAFKQLFAKGPGAARKEK